MKESAASSLRRRLLRWYRAHHRRLPWRETRDPYAIWISETMLQQTRSESVLRYFPRFLDRFPDVGTLARARESSVLAMWSGLGYYSRARNLHRAAREIVKRHGGELPADAGALRALPGIGRYTAGAVASIAFGIPTPVLDGNVARVLARLFAIRGRRRVPAVERRLWKIAAGLVPKRRPGDWNQALMELGATVCTPREPRCFRCPLRADCAALRSVGVDRFPAPARRLASVSVRRAVAVIERDAKVLLVRSDHGRLLRNLYEFPEIGELARLRIPARIDSQPMLRIRHAIMNRRIETEVYRASLPSGRRWSPAGGPSWFSRRRLRRLPLSTVGLRIAAHLGQRHSPASTRAASRGIASAKTVGYRPAQRSPS